MLLSRHQKRLLGIKNRNPEIFKRVSVEMPFPVDLDISRISNRDAKVIYNKMMKYIRPPKHRRRRRGEDALDRRFPGSFGSRNR